MNKLTISAIIIASIFTSACKDNTNEEVSQITSRASIPVEESTDVEILYSDSAKLKAKMTAPLMYRKVSTDPTIEMPKGVKVIFYNTNLEPESSLKANYGLRYLNRGLTRVAGNVVVINTQGDTMNTEEMFWDEGKGKVYSQKFVRVRRAKETILSEGFESDLSFTDYTFYKIKAILAVKNL